MNALERDPRPESHEPHAQGGFVHEGFWTSAERDPKLIALRQLYAQMPPRWVRFETVIGHKFLLRLKAVRKCGYTRKRLADTLGVSTTALDKMLKKKTSRPGKRLINWPGPDDMAPLRALWVACEERSVARTDPRYIEIREALGVLLTDFELYEIALALKVKAGVLHKIVEDEPLQTPEAIARRVKKFLNDGDEPES